MSGSLWGWLGSLIGASKRRAFESGRGPARLLVMRHAEKPPDKRDMHLSAAGVVRAERLATFIPQTFGTPDFIIAAMQSKHSNRSYETVVPLSRATGVAIDERFKDDDTDGLVAALRVNSQFAGKLGVISWHHTALPGLIGALGAPAGSFPEKWGADVFNLIVELDYRTGWPPIVRTCIEDF